MKNPRASLAKHSSPQASPSVGVRTVIRTLVLFLSAAVVAIPVAYSDDGQTPSVNPDEAAVETQQNQTDSTPATPATDPEMNELTRQQPASLLDSAIDEWPVQTLDLGLCDGS